MSRLELLGYPLDSDIGDNISYDENGFIILNNNGLYSSLFFEDENQDKATMFIHLREKTDTYYNYSIQVNETAGVAYGGVGYGEDVKIYYVNGIISRITVNGVENGNLHDQYDDCFNIKPDMYMHIINKNYRINLLRAGC